MSAGSQTDGQQMANSLVEMDSPTKRYHEFTEMIGETEASMRGKLSELTMPDAGDPSGLTPEKDVTEHDISLESDYNPGGADTQDTDNFARQGENDPGNSVMDFNPGNFPSRMDRQMPSNNSGVSGSTTGATDKVTELLNGKQSLTDDIGPGKSCIAETSGKHGSVKNNTDEKTGVDKHHVSNEASVIQSCANVKETHADDLCSNQDIADDVQDKQSNTDADSNTRTVIDADDIEHTLTDGSIVRNVETICLPPDDTNMKDKDVLQTDKVRHEGINGESIEKLSCRSSVEILNEVAGGNKKTNDIRSVNETLNETNIGKSNTESAVVHDNDKSTDTSPCTLEVNYETNRETATAANERVNNGTDKDDNDNIQDNETIDDTLCKDILVENDSVDSITCASNISHDANAMQVTHTFDYKNKEQSEVANADREGMNSESVMTECNKEMKHGFVKKGKENVDGCNELHSSNSENNFDEGFMITDVRSLSEDSISEDVIDNDKRETEANVKSDLGDMHDTEDTDADNPNLTDQAILDESETSQPLSDAKRKRKSPNTVKRIPLADSGIGNDLEEQGTSDAVPKPPEVSPVNADGRNETGSVFASEPAVSTVSNLTSVESETLPVISNTFSMAAFSNSSPVIKEEPADYEMYGMMPNNANVIQTSQSAPDVKSQQPAVSFVPGTPNFHTGRIVNQATTDANTSKLVMSKVPQVKLAFPTPSSTQSTTITRFPVTVAYNTSSTSGKVQTGRILMPKTSVTMSGKDGKATVTTAELAKDLSKGKPKVIADFGKKFSTINIHSVGVARITDLIARKNPIPTYKPAPRPPEFGDGRNTVYPCYECGDSFLFEKSLKNHFGRCSMKIYYKCEKCLKTIMFRNKCQLLNHLRSHLNIKKTQAVPIHIKSDSIEIETNFNDIKQNIPFEWYREANPEVVSRVETVVTCVSNVEKSKGYSLDERSSSTGENTEYSKIKCLECSKEFESLNELENHFKGDNSEHFFCNECPIFLNTNCALNAHKKLHEITDLKLNKPLNPDEWKLLKSLSCPECGIGFWIGLGSSSLGNFLSLVTLHLKNTCFHLSRLPAFTCSKCMKLFQSFVGLRNHLNTSLEHYYKCGMCPMALKSLKSLDSHYNLKHKAVDESEEKEGSKSKLIYRCHVCDTLIDDKTFLVQHTEKHLEEIKKQPQTHYHCLQCGQMFMSRFELKLHSTQHKGVKRHFYCTFCNCDKGKPLLYISHVLKSHTASKSNLASKSVVKFCDFCGLVCIGEHMIKNHACLGIRNARRIVGDRTRPIAPNVNQNEINTAESTRTEVVAEIKNDIPNHLSRVCLFCGTPFNSQSYRLNHLKDHRDNDDVFICKLCDALDFKTSFELRSHEIACIEMRKISKDGEPALSQGKFRSQQSKTKDNSENANTGEVELIPKGRAGSSKRKRDVVDIYMCDKCDAVFTRKSKQEEHVKSEHGFHPCHLCGVIHESQSTLKKHLMVDHEGKRTVFYCRICRSRKTDRPFTVRAKLENHLRMKHRMKVIDESKIITELPGLPEPSDNASSESQKRNATVPSSPETSVKKLKIEGESDFKCAKCLFTCDIKLEFRQHILEHKAANTYQCFECGLCFAVLPSLKKHLFMVHKVRDFASYMEENQIEEPETIEDNDEEEDIKPEVETTEAMEESSEEEQGDNALECKVCYRSFDTEKALRSHMRTHGMAFIKKSRRRTLASSAEKKEDSKIQYVHSNEGGKKEGLILKIKMNRLEAAKSVCIPEVEKSVSGSKSVKNEVAQVKSDTDSFKTVNEAENTDKNLVELDNLQQKMDIELGKTDSEEFVCEIDCNKTEIQDLTESTECVEDNYTEKMDGVTVGK